MEESDQSSSSKDGEAVASTKKSETSVTNNNLCTSLQDTETELISEKTNESSDKCTSSKIVEQESGDIHAIDESNLHYENDICIYTEPESKCEFVWDVGMHEWVPRNNSNSFTDKDYEYDGKTYTYRDIKTNIKYFWDVNNSKWKAVSEDKNNKTHENTMKEESEEEDNSDEDVLSKKPKEIIKQDMSKGHYGFENGTHTYTDPSDGSKYLWDKEKSAWFPKVDDDFLAQYQMNYGFVDPNENQPKTDTKQPEPPPPIETESVKRKTPQEPAWFDVGEESTKVYVSGLPLDITEAEFVDVMQKCGLVMRDVENNKMKIKIYLDPQTSLPKGDALCTYIKKESVELALNLLDGSDVRGHRISVEKAKFTMKGKAYDPSLKPKKKRKKDKEKLKKLQEKLFDWRPDKMRGERSKHEQIVIIKNLFDPAIFNKDVKLILEYQQDLRDECLKCGAVKKVVIYDRHPEGVAQISFKEVEAADACVQLLNGRWFGQRKITAETWDGKTKYKISETDEQIKARLAKWEKFLETGESAKEENKKREKSTENMDCKEEIVSKGDQDEDKLKIVSSQVKLESKEVKKETEDIKRDSDQDTRSSVESDYDTDEDIKTSN